MQELIIQTLAFTAYCIVGYLVARLVDVKWPFWKDNKAARVWTYIIIGAVWWLVVIAMLTDKLEDLWNKRKG